MMGDFEDKKTSSIDPFTDTLFSWSLEDISNENLYRDKVEEIPDAFKSIKSYLGSYMYPLLEETRAQVFSSMEILSRAPFAEVVAHEGKSSHGAKEYQVTVDYWRNRYNDRSKEPYKTLPGDLLLLTNAKPETLSDLGRVGRSWAFLSVTNITEEFENVTKNGVSVKISVSSTYFKVKGSKELELEFEKRSSLFVVYLVNTIPNKRIWKALHMLRNPEILNVVLCNDSLVDHDLDSCSEGNDNLSYENFVTSLGSNLNESQNKAVLSCLHSLKCKKKSAFELIWGPPGTGKTKTVATLLVALLKMKVRTLICAPTNVAITEVASRVMKMVADSEAEDSFYSFGDILLFGNKERLKVGSDSDIQEIYLEYRVQMLGECFGPLGLSSCFLSMVTFLEDCVPQYHVFLENESIREKEEKELEETELDKDKKESKKKGIKDKNSKKESKLIEEKEEIIEKKVKSFIEYVRERFVATVEPLRKCISIFCTHVPKSYISEHNCRNMMFLIGLLDCLNSILFQDNVVSEELQELFSRPEAVEDQSDAFVDRMSLPSVIRACLYFLRSLHGSLKELKLPSYRNEEIINLFCFQRASLVFCTVSTSYKLHRMEIAPMNVLVIDEAAQLKECESTIPLQLPGIKNAILVGDECQLPATITSKIAEESGFGRSLFERFSSLNHPKHLLNVQYRMHPSISRFPNSQFYQNRIQDATIVRRKSYEKHFLPGPMFGSYSFLNVIGGREEKDDDGHSRKNMVEVAIVLKIVQSLYKAWVSESRSELSVGIISPYAAQVVSIEEKLGKKYNGIDGFRVKAKTVDGFQGGEDDIIIISTVRSDSGQSLEFISNPRRVNVALTRARHSLWILGNERTLTNSESIWGTLVIDAKNRGCFFNADDEKDLAKTILEVKKELDQFDDLLNADSVCFRDSKWKVLFSDSFLKSFKKLTSVRIKKSVLNLLLKLSGGWRPKRQVLASGGGSSLEIMNFRVEGFNVICTKDILKVTKYKQVLRIWDILSPDDIPKLVKRLEGIFGKYTDEFIKLCNEKFLEGDLEVPKSWPPSMEIIRIKDLLVNETGSDVVDVASDGRSYVENSRVSESLLLMKFYSLSYGVVNHLLSDRDGRELDLPFEVTDQEMEIIIFPRSTFVLGRSGTGKTTVLTMKLFQKEQLHHKAVSELYIDNSNESGASSLDSKRSSDNKVTKVTILRQLFVTVSPKLCNAVKKHVSDLKSFACGKSEGSNSSEMEAIDDEEEQFKNVPDSFIDITANSYPLVVTFHKFLMMLDGSLSKSFFERFLDMPSVSHNNRRSSRSVVLQNFLRTKEVNYDKFSLSYWPHFDSNLTKKLDPSRVFTEIISHIKGGPRAMDSNDFKLGREDYVRLSEGRSSTVSGMKREKIFDIFQMYEKMKNQREEFDLSDFVISLHCRLRHERYEGDQMDYVYIDEVQDLTMSQIALFRHVCCNVEEGFVFSGDTAQTIARGIDFRFQDIRSLFYKRFLLGSKTEHEDRTEKGILSGIFSLSQNFRTHAGILKLSQSVVDLLYHYFPQSIDVLRPETSLIYGEAPVLLQSVNNENAIAKIFGNNAKDSGKIVGFGAEQVILVRDDNARREISELVGKQALLLTVLECKGLEFQDVLLYNFFGSSPLRNQWRVIYEYMKEMNMFDSAPPNCPKFSESKHNILCSELKQLYVAVTRTRQRLWICENAELSDSEPMFDYWNKKCLVQVRQLDDSLAQAMQVSSSPEEWRSRGIKLFYEKNYEWATVCFERAHDKYWEQMSKASGLKAMSDNMRTSKPEEANSVLREAAEIFESIGKADFAAKCFVDLGEYERAGKIYLEKFGGSELARAAECFSLAGCYELSAKVYARGNFFSECLNVCSKGKLFDLGLEYIKDWKQNSTKECGTSRRGQELEKIEQKFLERCAFHYHEIKDKRSMMNFVRVFDSMDSIRNFLRPLGCFDELMSMEEESGNFVEAANIAKLKGDILLLIDLLGKAQKFKEASGLILFYVLAKSLWSPGKGWPLKQFNQKDELLTKAKHFAKSESEIFYEFVCVEADILSNSDNDLTVIMNQILTSQKHKSVRGEILSTRKVLESHLSSKPNKYFLEEELVSDPKRYSEETMLKNRVSVESLVFFWDSWMNQISNIFEYLGHIATDDVNELRNHGDFCLNFFGVWRQFQNLNPVYLLLSSDADWAIKVVKRPLWNNGLLVSMDVHRLASSARVYWSAEVLSVGIKVLEKMKSIYHIFKTQNRVSLFHRSNTLTFIYRVANDLLESKHLKQSHRDSEALNGFIKLAVDDFVSYVFASDLRKPVTSSNMVRLRGTDISKTLLTRFMARYTGSRDLSYGEIGSIAMIVMGSGMINDELYKMIVKGLNWNPLWEGLLRDLCGIRELGVPKQTELVNSGGVIVHIIRRLYGALSDALNVNFWNVRDYISPHCFFYLVESLLNLAASIQGHIVATKSSFVEWLVFQDSYPKTHLTAPNSGQLLETIREFTIHVVKVWLNNWQGMTEWVRKSYKSVDQYSLLVTRMIVILCLLQANFGKCTGLLFQFLGRQDIGGKLPWEFRNTLMRGRDRRYLNVLSEAFKKINDPLVIVDLGGSKTPLVSCPHTVFVDMKSNRSKDSILTKLFPQKTRDSSSKGSVTTSAAEDGDSGRQVLISTTDSSTKQCPEAPRSNPKLEHDQNSSSSKGNESSSQSEPGFFWDVFEEIRSCEDVTEHRQFYAKKIKENLDKCTPFLTVDDQKIHIKTPEEQNQFVEMVDDLKLLLAALETSELEFPNRVSLMKELCKRLQSRRPAIEPILKQLLGKQGIGTADHVEAETFVVPGDPCREQDCDVFDKSEISQAIMASGTGNDETICKGNESNPPTDSGFFWEVVEVIWSLEDVAKCGQFYSKKIKEALEKFEPFLTVGDNQKIHIESHEELNQFVEMIDELKQLQATLNTSHSEVELPDRASSMRELCKRLKSRRQTMEPVLNRLLGQQGTDIEAEALVVVPGDPCNDQVSDVVAEDDGVSEMDKSEVAQASLASGNINSGKAKGKKKSKNRKKNKGKKKVKG